MIVDPVVRKAVQEKFAQLGGGDPKKVFADLANHPCLVAKDGRKIPIHKVRIRVGAKPTPVGTAHRQRFVASGQNSNHHLVIVAVLDANGKETKWEEHIISRLEAHIRFSKANRKKGQPIIQKDWGPGKRFKFSLMPRDMISMLDQRGVRQLYKIDSISKGDYEVRLHTDARTSTEREKEKARVRLKVEKMRKGKAYKVSVSPLGECVPVHD